MAICVTPVRVALGTASSEIVGSHIEARMPFW
jgi:hypothetical protein